MTAAPRITRVSIKTAVCMVLSWSKHDRVRTQQQQKKKEKKRLDDDADVHVKATSDVGAGQRLGSPVLLTQVHESGHLTAAREARRMESATCDTRIKKKEKKLGDGTYFSARPISFLP